MPKEKTKKKQSRKVRPLTPEQEKYKNEQKERLGGLQPGADDLLGNTIRKIYARGDEYIVYEIECDSPIEALRVRVDTQIEDNLEPIRRYQSVKNELDKFKSVLYKTGADVSYSCRAATAVSLAIHGEVDDAKKLFKEICADARSEYREKQTGRLYYLWGATIIVFVLGLTSILTYLNRESQFVVSNIELFDYLYCIFFAAIGGLFSVSIRLKQLNIGQELKKHEYAIYGSERIMFSVLGGIVIFTMLKAGLILEPLTRSATGNYAALTFCFVAGFSETFIPNVLSQLENNSGN